MRFRIRRAAPRPQRFSAASKESMTQLSVVLLKIIGESVQGRWLRAFLVAGVSGATFFVQDVPPVVPDPPAVVIPAQVAGK